MAAAATARERWAARQPPSAPHPASSAIPDAKRPLSVAIASGASSSLLLLAAAMIVCAVAGFAITYRNDARLANERHFALQVALDEMRAVFGEVERFDYGQLRMIERRSGLKDLRFAADPVEDGVHEVQSLHNERGRIVGWFNWLPDRALIRAMNLLWALVGAVGVALVLCAIIARHAAQRLARGLARSMVATQKLITEDALTGLANQRVVLESLDRALQRMARGDGPVALLLLNLDGFDEINDTFGRKAGDEMLRNTAVRIQASLPDGALLGRFENAFAIVISGDAVHPDHAVTLGRNLCNAIARPLDQDQNWRVTASVGVAQAPEDGTSGEQLAQRASLALRTAKREKRGTVRRFDPQIESERAERLFLLRELKSAISRRALDVHYQPIVAADGAGIVGVEALLRWTHPERGAIAPSTFIPIAEQHELMQELGEFVLRRALADAARWPDVFVAVNLSPLQIRDDGLVELVRTAMADSGIAASRLVLEITEGVLIDDPDEAQGRLEALRALGVGLALDDFGTGYSSLGYLQKFPFQRLKIDRTFAASLGRVGNVGAIIHAIVTLGHALGLKVLAEGVETDEQRVLLRLAGCDEMQGYVFAMPGPAEAIDAMLIRPPVAAASIGATEISAR